MDPRGLIGPYFAAFPVWHFVEQKSETFGGIHAP